MKIIYMKPELTVIKINKPCLLNASLPEGEEYDGNTTVLSKGGSMLWSDDDWTYDPEEEE